ncbi:MAG: gliding motility-associated C-terminal domain-containing protein, partial [Bacteroidota bacterium]
LIGSNSIGDNLSYTWFQRIQGVDVEIGMGETLVVTDPTPGLYTLQVIDVVTNCENAIDDDSRIIEVLDGRITPTACALEVNGGAAVQEQNCDGTAITFSASCSNVVGMVPDYEWFEYDSVNDEFGASIGFGNLEQDVVDLGVYALTVLNLNTGCVDTTFVEVIPNASAPQVVVDEAQAIDCNDPEVVLNATLIPNDASFTFVWTELDGGELDDPTEDSLTPTATNPGTFQIVVTNPDNNCTAEAFVQVADETELPSIDITTDLEEVSCFDPEATLQSMGGDADGIFLQWYQDSISIITEIPGENNDSLQVNNGGIYILEASNPATGCTASDTTTVAEFFDTPMLTLDQTEPELNCNDSTAMVTVTVTGSTDFTVGDWTGPGVVQTTNGGLTVEVNAGGVYSLNVVDNVSGCDTDQDFSATENFVEPTAAVANNMLTVNCANEMTGVTLDGTGSSVGQDFTYLWENQDGAGPDDPTALSTTTSVPGNYILTVTNNDNGCVADVMVMVAVDTVAPVASIADVAAIDCDNPNQDLTVTVSNTANFIVEWAPPVTPSGAETVTVSNPGTYEVEVTDTTNGCSSTASVSVDGDNMPPDVIIATPASFDCPDEFITIDATGSGMADDFRGIQWFLNGDPIAGANDLTIDATMIGEYTLQLTLESNGCTGESLLNLAAASPLTLPQLPDLTNLDDLACDGSPVRIDASAAGNEADFSSITWTGGDFNQVSGFVIDAQEATTYTLMVVLDSPVPGCENSADYTVEPDPDTPVAEVVTDAEAQCGIPAVLDASGSTAPAMNITYQWVGTPALNDPAAVSPEATEAGTYQLIVTNTSNSCADTSEVVTVTFEFPDDADAGADAASCDDIFDLSGNLPTNGANITGVWTTASGAVIDMPDNPVTMVSSLAQGGNVFTWTLSADDCPNFSSDDVQITSASAPIANPDFLEIEADVLTGEVSLVANDILGGSTNFTITILNDPIFGTFDPAALELGTFALTLLPGQFGVSTVDYEICSTDCPDLCSTSTLNIAVAQSDNPFVPNVVTPNGDGDNDDLVFDVITFSDPEEIPDNELIIFNRWGDIIFEAKPYNNDWNGLNQEGQPIPEATYYYVLRLNISRGEIIRGDITVIR